jgi:hypothetical protein
MKKYFFLFSSIFLFSETTDISFESAYAQIYSSSTQTPAPITGSLIKAEHISVIKNFELSEDKKFLTCKSDGIYNITVSIQAAALNLNINGYLNFWLELNGKLVADACSRVYITKTSPIIFAAVPFLFSLKSGDVISERFSTSGSDIGITYIDAPSINEPIIPSYISNIYKVSEL